MPQNLHCAKRASAQRHLLRVLSVRLGGQGFSGNLRISPARETMRNVGYDEQHNHRGRTEALRGNLTHESPDTLAKMSHIEVDQ